MKIGVVIAYYGGLHPKHAETLRDIARAGIPIVHLQGGPYPEISRAEAVQLAITDNVDVLVMLDGNVSTTAEDVRTLAAIAVRNRGVAIAQTYEIQDGCPRGWNPSIRNRLAFCAIDKRVIDRMAEGIEPLETGLLKGRPFFSPWTQEGQLLCAGYYCPDDVAFLVRVRQLGFDIVYSQEVFNYEILYDTKYSERISISTESRDSDYAICIPIFGPHMAEQYRLVWELEKRHVPVIEVHNCPYIDLARSRLVQIALTEHDFAGILFLDHDIIFNPKDLLLLIETAKEQNTMVSAAYCMRKSAHAIIGGFKKKPGDVVTWYEGGGLEPALYTGLGFSAIPRKIFEDMNALPLLEAGYQKPLRPYFSLDVTGSFYCGEDASFCNRVQGLTVRYLGNENWEFDHGTENKILIDTRVRIGHHGSYTYALEDAGVVVPRLQTLKTVCVGNREDAKLSHLSAYDLPLELKQEALDLAQEDLWKDREHASA